MSVLLDTNAISEWVKPRPNPGLIRWMDSVDEDRVFVSVISVAELRFGVDGMPAGKRRAQLERWFHHDLVSRFEGRILPVDARIAQFWGVMCARSEAIGRPMGIMDAFLSATAEIHQLTLITRNFLTSHC